jgi:hypothetical protein
MDFLRLDLSKNFDFHNTMHELVFLYLSYMYIQKL